MILMWWWWWWWSWWYFGDDNDAVFSLILLLLMMIMMMMISLSYLQMVMSYQENVRNHLWWQILSNIYSRKKWQCYRNAVWCMHISGKVNGNQYCLYQSEMTSFFSWKDFFVCLKRTCLKYLSPYAHIFCDAINLFPFVLTHDFITFLERHFHFEEICDMLDT